MEKKQVTIEGPINVSGLRITSVAEITTYGWQNEERLSFMGLKKPLYILISDGKSALKVFTATGQESSLGQILLDYPELRETFNKTPDINDASQ
jgi:hypothetical protein